MSDDLHRMMRMAKEMNDDFKRLGVTPEAETERLRAENAALREIVEAVAEGPYYIDGQDYVCAFCDKAGALPPTIRHAPDCRVVKSRVLLGWIDA